MNTTLPLLQQSVLTSNLCLLIIHSKGESYPIARNHQPSLRVLHHRLKITSRLSKIWHSSNLSCIKPWKIIRICPKKFRTILVIMVLKRIKTLRSKSKISKICSKSSISMTKMETGWSTPRNSKATWGPTLYTERKSLAARFHLMIQVSTRGLKPKTFYHQMSVASPKTIWESRIKSKLHVCWECLVSD